MRARVNRFRSIQSFPKPAAPLLFSLTDSSDSRSFSKAAAILLACFAAVVDHFSKDSICRLDALKWSSPV